MTGTSIASVSFFVDGKKVAKTEHLGLRRVLVLDELLAADVGTHRAKAAVTSSPASRPLSGRCCSSITRARAAIPQFAG